MTGAEAMVKCLEAEGINLVFGYPGVAIAPFYEGLYNSDIEHILVRQEQNAGHAASGYARMSRRPAVCVVTSGRRTKIRPSVSINLNMASGSIGVPESKNTS